MVDHDHGDSGWWCTDISRVDDDHVLGLVCWWFGYIDLDMLVYRFWYIKQGMNNKNKW